jgi:hypothetical protein
MSTRYVCHSPTLVEFVSDRPATPLENMRFVAILAQMVGRHAPDWTLEISHSSPAGSTVSTPVEAAEEPAPAEARAATEAAGAGNNFPVAVTS